MTDTQTVITTKHFSSIGDLITMSWARTKLAMKNLILLTLVVYGIFLVAGVIFGVLLVGGGLMGAASNPSGGLEAVSAGIMSLMPVIIAVYFVVLFIAIMISTLFGTAMMLAVAKAEEKPSLGSLIGASFKLFIPMLTTSLIVGFLVVGGFNVFVIPAIIIAIFMSFSSYEVILSGQKNLTAMKNSATIINQHFGDLLARVAVMIGISIGISVISTLLQLSFAESSMMSNIIGFASSIVQAVFSWVVIAYQFIIYNEARSQTDFSKPASITWMWVVSIIGWVIMLLIGVGVTMALSAATKDGSIEKLINQAMKAYDTKGTSSSTDSATMMDYESIMSEDGETVDTDALIDMYGSELSDEDKEMMRGIIESSQEPSN